MRSKSVEDTLLPQCRVVKNYCRNGAEEDCGMYVILRQTSYGHLVVRRVDDIDGPKLKFKASRSGRFIENVTKTSPRYGELELRDIPVQFKGADEANKAVQELEQEISQFGKPVHNPAIIGP